MSKERSLNDLIDAALRQYNFDDMLTRSQIETAYRKVVGEFIVKLTRDVRYDNQSHTLRVTLSAPALKNELSYKLTDLVEAINKEVGLDQVKKIYLL